MRPPHAVGPVGDQRVEAGGHDGAEPLRHTIAIDDAAQVNGFGRAVRDDIGRGLGIAGGSRYSRAWSLPVPARSRPAERRPVPTPAGRRDDAVAAGHHQRVGAAVQRIVDQPSRVFGVGADDFDDVDAPLLKSCDGPLGRMRRVAIGPRRD